MPRTLKHYRSRVDQFRQKLSQAKQQVRSERESLEHARNLVADTEQAQHVVQRVAQKIQREAHDRIASVVSRCLSAVFDDPYEFRIVFERKRGRTEARLIFVKRKRELSPRSGVGGGVLDVAAFALRLACILLTRPARRRLVVMDEPFKNVHSPLYRERVRLMLDTLAREMNVQFIMSTGIDELQTGKVVEL